jgi:hypothetical protein
VSLTFDFDVEDSGLPRVLKRFAAEAWRRAEAGELSDAELYPSDAAWSGLCDRPFPHKDHDLERRLAVCC